MQKIDGSQLISEITLDDLQKAVGGFNKLLCLRALSLEK